MKLVAVSDEEAQGQTFLNMKVIGIDGLDDLSFDAILFTKHAQKDDAILLKLLATKGKVVDLFKPEAHL